MSLIIQIFLSMVLLFQIPKFWFLLLLFLFIFIFLKPSHYILIVLFISIFYLRLQCSTPSPNFKQPFLVVNQNTVRQNFSHYQVFSKEPLLPSSIVYIEGSFKTSTSSFQDSLRLNHRYSTLYLNNVQYHGKSFIHQFLYDLSPLLNKIFYFSKVENNSVVFQLIISAGLIFSSLFQLIYKTFRLKYSSNTSNLLLIISLFIFTILFGFRFVFTRYLIQTSLKLTSLNKTKRSLIECCMVYFIYPFAIRELAFLMVYSLKLQHFIFSNRKFIQIKQFIFIVLIQTLTLSHCYLFATALFIHLRKLSLILLFLPQTLINHLDQLFLNFEKIDFQLVGRMPLVLVLIILYALVFETKVKVQIWLIGLSFLLYYSYYHFNPSAQIIYLNIGQGDATLLIAPYQKEIILIDTGKKNQQIQLTNALNRYGITHIDTLIISHQDEDHAGNKAFLCERYGVKNLIENKSQAFQPLYFNLTSHLINRNYEDDNDNSLVYSLILNHDVFLFLGDISRSVERDLIQELNHSTIHVLKLAHHGSRSSTDEYLLSKFLPHFAIISSDPKAFGHPHFEVIDLLRKFKINTFMTFRDDDIQFIYFKGFQVVITQHIFLWMK